MSRVEREASRRVKQQQVQAERAAKQTADATERRGRELAGRAQAISKAAYRRQVQLGVPTKNTRLAYSRRRLLSVDHRARGDFEALNLGAGTGLQSSIWLIESGKISDPGNAHLREPKDYAHNVAFLEWLLPRLEEFVR